MEAFHEVFDEFLQSLNYHVPNSHGNAIESARWPHQTEIGKTLSRPAVSLASLTG